MARDPHGNKLGRNDPCWCGSGRKFKQCHLQRASEPHPSRVELFDALKASFSDKYCSCSLDRRRECKGNIVRAHSLSRRNALAAVTEEGHVFSLTPHWPSLFFKDKFEFKNKSAHEASTFTGFCEYHDNEIFRDLDRHEFDGGKTLTVLSAYRTVCREIFMKKGHISTGEHGRRLDRGRSPERQLFIQEATTATIDGATAALEELSDFKKILETSLRSANYDDFRVLNLHFPASPELVTAGAFNPTHTLSGDFIQDLSLPTYSQNICFSILPTKTQTFWASLLWQKSHTLLDKLTDDLRTNFCTVGGIYALATAHIENTFLRPSFWASLDNEKKAFFHFLSLMDVLHFDYVRAKAAADALSEFRPTLPDQVVAE